MGNEQSHESASGSENAEEDEKFDLSAIEDSRNHRLSSVTRTPSPQPTEPRRRNRRSRQSPSSPSQTRPPAVDGPLIPSSEPQQRPRSPGMAQDRARARPRANSSKKRKGALDGFDERQQSEQYIDEQPEPDAETDLAEDIILRSQSQRIREQEPEMFGEYALSDESEAEHHSIPTDLATADAAAPAPDPVPSGQMMELPGFDDIIGHETQDETPDEQQDNAAEYDAAKDDTANDDVSMLDPPVEVAAPLVTERANSSDNTTAASIFDHAVEGDAVMETPLSKPPKRKRVASTSPKKVYSVKKRRREPTPPTSPESVASEENRETSEQKSNSLANKQIRRQSSLETFALPYSKESGLRHPMYYPETPDQPRPRMRVEVVVPMSQAGSSTHPDLKPGLKRPSKSPAKQRHSSGRREIWDVHNQPDAPGLTREGLAKTIARRALGQTGDDSSSSDSDGDDSDADTPAQNAQVRRPSSKGKDRAPSPEAQNGAAATKKTEGGRAKNPSASQKSNGKPRRNRLSGSGQFRCRICNVPYATARSLEQHLRKPDAHDHLHDCPSCEEQFATRAALTRHQLEMGHGTSMRGSTGRFEPDEKETIARWRDRFCEEHGLNHYEFNEVMTASCRQGNKDWTYQFMSKADFLNEYYDVLPDRDRRSMQRYREKFQNVDYSREWSQEDDQDIKRLVGELGYKWHDIGERLTRDPEAIRARWKNKLALGDQLETGHWSAAEMQRFNEAVEEVRQLSPLTASKELDEKSFNWTAVSKLVDTRSAQQCANHWRARHGKMVRGLWVDAGTSQLLHSKIRTSSKMERRLAGKKLSADRVEDSDGDMDDDEESNNVDGDGQDDATHEQDDTSPEDAGGALADNDDLQQSSDDQENPAPGFRQQKTPGKHLTASQAFEETQAHTSALRSADRRRKDAGPSQELPSPGVPVQVRPDHSPEFAQKLRALFDENDNADAARDGADKDVVDTVAVNGHETDDDSEPEQSSSGSDDDEDSDGDETPDAAAAPVPVAVASSTSAGKDPVSKARLDQMFDKASRKAKGQQTRPRKKRRLAFMDSDSEKASDDSGSEVDLPRG